MCGVVRLFPDRKITVLIGFRRILVAEPDLLEVKPSYFMTEAESGSKRSLKLFTMIRVSYGNQGFSPLLQTLSE